MCLELKNMSHIGSRWKLKGSIIFCLFIFVVCNNDLTPPKKTPVSLEIRATSLTIYSGGTIQLEAIVGYTNGNSDDVTDRTIWSISPGRLGSLNQQGLFTALLDSVGLETVCAEFQGQRNSVEIEITRRARSLMVWPGRVTVSPGEKAQLQAIAEFYMANSNEVVTENVTDLVDWSSTPGQMGTIDANGLFSSNPGFTGLETVVAAYHALTARCYIQVQDTSSVFFDMITIPAGSFIMGDNGGLYNEKPAHNVYLDAFQISKYEVTNSQYANFINKGITSGDILISTPIVTGRRGPYAWLEYFRFSEEYFEYQDQGMSHADFRVKPGFENDPVVGVTWYGASAFCALYGYRLPTEAEWEKACRGGLQLVYGTQDGTIGHDLANYVGIGDTDCYTRVAPVGSFPPNPYGIYDMAGNAAEFVFDVYDPNYYSNSPLENPIGPGPLLLIGRLPEKVALWRGGSYADNSSSCRSSYRGIYDDQVANSFIGFRVARSLD
jgi:formylglycine-generating enzyme required for sulfatase activity